MKNKTWKNEDASHSSSSHELRRRAENIVLAKDPQYLEKLKSLPTVEIGGMHEIQVHQIELELQNQELIRTQAEMDTLIGTYSDFYNLAPVGYFTVSEQGLILEANITAASLLGVPRGSLVGEPLTRFIFKEDQDIYYHHRKYFFEAHSSASSIGKAGKTGVPHTCELRMVKDDGTFLWVNLKDTVAHDAEGVPLCRMVMIDVTAHKEIEKALCDSEIKYRRLFESAKDGILILDAETGMVDDVNPFLIEMLGYSKEQFLGKKVWDLGLFKDIVSNQDNFLELQGREYIRYEDMPLETADGRRIDVEFISNVYIADRKKVIQCNIRNISDRKLIENTLSKTQADLNLSEKRQTVLSKSAALLLGAVEPQEIIYKVCNDTMESLDCQVFLNFLFVEEKNKLKLNAYSGITDAEALRIKWLDLGVSVCGCVARDGESIIVEDISSTKDPVTDFLRGYGVHAYWCHPLKVGECVLGTISFGTKNRDKFTEEEILMMRATAELIKVAMQRKEWERKLIESEERLMLAQTSANIGVWEWDKNNGKFISTPELSRLYGKKPYVIGKYEDVLGKVHPDDLSRVENEYEDAIASHRAFDLEFRINYSEDEVRWLSSKGGAIYNEQGEIVRVFGVNADITVRKLAESVLKRDNDTLENLVRERSGKLAETQVELERSKRLSDIGTLASTVAHELRNPLAAITISAAIIRRRSRNKNIEDQLKSIDKMVMESDQIINNLLFYSRLRSPHYESIAIYDIICECVENLTRQIRKNMRFKRNFDLLKDFMLRSDPVQMKEVFNNLLHNAADAVPDDCGEVEIFASDYPEFIKIHIKDNGHGIDARDMEKIFDPFFTTKAKGTGLGLTVCKQIVNLHGGSIDMESEPGKGTTATIILPKRGISNK